MTQEYAICHRSETEYLHRHFIGILTTYISQLNITEI